MFPPYNSILITRQNRAETTGRPLGRPIGIVCLSAKIRTRIINRHGTNRAFTHSGFTKLW